MFLQMPRNAANYFFDSNTHLIAWSGSFVLAFGFLINSFYDYEADTINRPKQSAFERLVSRKTSLNTALLLLVVGLLTAYLVSMRALGFFTVFALGLWYHSHKLRNIPIVSHTSAAILCPDPFLRHVRLPQLYLCIPSPLALYYRTDLILT